MSGHLWASADPNLTRLESPTVGNPVLSSVFPRLGPFDSAAASLREAATALRMTQIRRTSP